MLTTRAGDVQRSVQTNVRGNRRVTETTQRVKPERLQHPCDVVIRRSKVSPRKAVGEIKNGVFQRLILRHTGTVRGRSYAHGKVFMRKEKRMDRQAAARWPDDHIDVNSSSS